MFFLLTIIQRSNNERIVIKRLFERLVFFRDLLCACPAVACLTVSQLTYLIRYDKR
jgi:hypothetical protein